MTEAAIFWLIVLLGCIFVEIATVSLTSIWFAAGALIAMIAAMLKLTLWQQVALFVVVSALCLLALRPLVRKFFTPRLTRTNVDAVIGTEGIVQEDIDNIASQGRIKLGAMEWTARSSSGAKIPAGSIVKVDRIEGVKAFVTPVAVEEEVK